MTPYQERDRRRQPGPGPLASTLPASPAGRMGLALPPPEGISYLKVALGHKLILLGFILLGGLAGTAYILIKAPVFAASTTVELVGFNQTFMGMNNVDPQAGTDSTSASASNIQTQLRN